MAKNYRVFVVTRSSRRKAIEGFLKDHPVPDLTFEYVDFPDWVIRFKKGSLTMNLYYLCWQGLAFLRARKLVEKERIELAHHVSFMSLTRGSFVPFLGIKSILGPIGGLQTVPKAAEKIIRNRVTERIRNFGVRFFRWNPIGNLTSSMADLIVLANGANLDCLPKKAREKSLVGLQIGTEPAKARPTPSTDGTIVFRWVGRMIDHKGLELLIDILESLRDLRPEVFERVQVVVSGGGPLAEHYRGLIQKKDLGKAFEFVAWLSEEEMDELWGRCHAFLFTSLRETTGLALMEAMVRGVPPIVIDSGGPSEIVTEESGVKISGDTYEGLVENYREAMIRCVENPQEMIPLGAAARERILESYSWEAVGSRMDELYRNLLNC
ncbi:glycosyltransferase family 4 protein [bacterium]|nr:glycosyltransferase family 4 protein [bacterium]MDB4754148.1 glycosyltransferase family 4 protein [Akkermansiaceae bacterium]